MPSYQQSLAIVLRVVSFSETSCIVTFFTREYGKVSGIAKGARRAKSPLSLCRIVFIPKSSDALDIVTEAKLERRFRSATSDLSRLYAGYYFAELLNELTGLGDAYPDLFDVTEKALAAIDAGQVLAPLVLGWEMTLLRVLGHLPSWQRCASCGTEVAKAQSMAFGLLAGGVLCRRCRVGRRAVVQVDGRVIDIMERFSSLQCSLQQPLELEGKLRGQLRGVINQYIRHLLGRRLRVERYLKQMDL